jgi:hypothetical protein
MFRPTLPLLAIPIILITLSALPILELRIVLFGILGLPFSYTTGLPFPYYDKPWFVSPAGAIVIALTWSVLIYVLLCIVRHFKRKKGAEQDAAANP